MPRPWRRPRKEQEDHDAPASPEAPAVEEPAEPARVTEADGTRLTERLESVTSQYVRPPSADELRAAFGRKSTPDDSQGQPAVGSFESTYTAESLFVPTVEPPAEEDAQGEDRSRTGGDYYYDPDDAWAVLDLPQGASWPEIAAAHRRLAKKHHPDRLLDASEQEKAESEAAMRDINVAYSVLRRMTGH